MNNFSKPIYLTLYGTLTGTTIPDQGGPENNGNEGLYNHQYFRAAASLLDKV